MSYQEGYVPATFYDLPQAGAPEELPALFQGMLAREYPGFGIPAAVCSQGLGALFKGFLSPEQVLWHDDRNQEVHVPNADTAHFGVRGWECDKGPTGALSEVVPRYADVAQVRNGGVYMEWYTALLGDRAAYAGIERFIHNQREQLLVDAEHVSPEVYRTCLGPGDAAVWIDTAAFNTRSLEFPRDSWHWILELSEASQQLAAIPAMAFEVLDI